MQYINYFAGGLWSILSSTSSPPTSERERDCFGTPKKMTVPNEKLITILDEEDDRMMDAVADGGDVDEDELHGAVPCQSNLIRMCR